jgi:hypothetical protein
MARFSGGSGSGSGAPGPRGPQGIPGEVGPNGPDGLSAYEIAVANGFIGTEQDWLDSLGGAGTSDIADFVFTNVSETDSSMTITGDKEMTVESGATKDLNVRAGDQLWLTAGDDVILQADDGIQVRSNDNIEIMTNFVDNGDAEKTWEFTTQGELNLPGRGKIINEPDSSGDGFGYSTIKIVPDSTLNSDQYLIIDPTAPSHIHIRAGGEQDNSSADLILGAENTHVMVSDNNGTVSISSSTFGQELPILNEATEPSLGVITYYLGTLPSIGDTVLVEGTEYTVTEIDYSTGVDGQQIIYCNDLVFAPQTTYTFISQSSPSSWSFNSSGVFSGPNEGLVKVYGLYGTNDGPLTLLGPQGVVLDGDSGEFLNDASNPNNQIATLGDIQSAGTGDITFVENTISSDTGNNIVIQNKNADGIVKARITLDQSDEQVRIEAIDGRNEYFDSTQWATAVWSGNTVTITNTPDIINFFNTVPGNITKVSINDGTALNYDGGSYGSENITIYVVGNPSVEEDPLTITNIRFLYQVVSDIDISYDNEEFRIQSRGMDLNLTSDQEINLESNDDIDLSATNRVRVYGDNNVFLNSINGGVFIGTSVENDNVNQVATLGDIEQAIETGPSEVSFTVNGGTLENPPAFDGVPLFSGSYVKVGPQVHFQIQVDMDNITDFGTGQYYVDLPFPAKYAYQFKDGCLHDISTGNQFNIGGHVAAGSSSLLLTTVGSNGQDELFDHNSPVTLDVADNFHISGTYIIN